jgi:hypothetical protein
MRWHLCFVPVLVLPALLAQQPTTLASNPGATTTGMASGNSSAAPAAALPDAPGDQGPFFTRFIDAYKEDWNPTQPAAPAPVRRGYPAPLDSPPFPGGDYSVGGTPPIGAPDTQTYPLMQAINGNRTRTKVYGFDVSTSNKGDGANDPASYYYNPNRIIPDQEVLYIERLPDTVQTDHIDWGFRIAQLWGQDYRYTTSKGIFSQQLLLENHEYGYDPVMYYLDIYVPHIAKGMNVRIGRYISLPDIEAQLAPNNYTYSHSLLYSVDPYTQTGIVASIKLSDHWLVQAGISDGNDVALWTPDAKPTGTACVDYTWKKGGDALYTCANSFNSGKYKYNNLQSYYETWYHKINAKWHTDTETWYMYERQVPNIAGNVANPVTPELGANGAFCSAGERTCFAPEVAVVNYLENEINTHNYFSIRNEFVNDIKGQRTGYATKYSEHLVSYGHWIGSTILFRPELRIEHSYDLAAYDKGTKKTQFVAAGDLTVHF